MSAAQRSACADAADPLHTLSALSPSVSDPTLSDDDLSAALAQRSQATKTLLGRLSSLHFAGSGSGQKIEELENKCRDLLQEVSISVSQSPSASSSAELQLT